MITFVYINTAPTNKVCVAALPLFICLDKNNYFLLPKVIVFEVKRRNWVLTKFTFYLMRGVTTYCGPLM